MRGRKRGKIKRSEYRKNLKYLSLGIAAVVILLFGASSLYSAWGFSSVWGADVEFDNITFMGKEYHDVEDMPEYAFNVGSRTITADFDGSPVDDYDWVNAPLYWRTSSISYAAEGMKPKVNYDLSRFIYFNELTEEISEATGYVDISDDNETADIHFYFGFSVMFSTATYSMPNGAGRHQIFIPSADSDYAFYSEGLTESGEVLMKSEVAIRFAPTMNETFEYFGSVNDVRVYNTRAYYVQRSQDYVSDNYSIAYMNANYNWNSEEYLIPGEAEGIGIPNITYNVINSTTENMATIEVGAKLKAGIDPQVAVGGVHSIPEGGYSGYLDVTTMDVYNVGFIYDLVVAVSINDIPLYDVTARFAGGRVGIIFPSTEPMLWFNATWILLLVAIAIIVVFGRK